MKLLGRVAYLEMEDFKNLMFGKEICLPFGATEIACTPNMVASVLRQVVDDLEKHLEEIKNEEAKT